MTRVDQWERRFYEVLEAAASRPLAYGQHDCALFVAQCIKAITGADFGDRFRGTYKTSREAFAVCQAHGSLEALVTARLGPPGPPRRAKRGDIVAIPHARFGLSLGVCDGLSGIFIGQGGFLIAPRQEFSMSWPV